jgi:hypothetical protein
MTDPWGDVRDGKYQPDELDVEVAVYLAIEVEPLLSDADALLAVVRADWEYDAAQLDWYDAMVVNVVETEQQEAANKRLGAARDARNEALAALPEHLRVGDSSD